MPMWDDRIIVGYDSGIPYGTYRTNWKITLFFMGKFAISMGLGFHSKLLVYQAGYELCPLVERWKSFHIKLD